MLDELTDLEKRIAETEIQMIGEQDPILRAELSERLAELESRKDKIAPGAVREAVH